MKKYTHLFFDLDHTLWDFENNSKEALQEIFERFSLIDLGIPSAASFISVYKDHNYWMWSSFGNGDVAKEQLRVKRFELTLAEFGVNHRILGEEMAESYIRLSPTKKNLIPQAIEVLDYLKSNYQMFIVTNGFPEVQWIKLKNSGLEDYFTEVYISEEVGHKKPHPGIFDFALNASDARKEFSLMIGDSLEADIIGARESGIDQVYFNPDKKQHQELITFEINSLEELKLIL